MSTQIDYLFLISVFDHADNNSVELESGKLVFILAEETNYYYDNCDMTAKHFVVAI